MHTYCTYYLDSRCHHHSNRCNRIEYLSGNESKPDQFSTSFRRALQRKYVTRKAHHLFEEYSFLAISYAEAKPEIFWAVTFATNTEVAPSLQRKSPKSLLNNRSMSHEMPETRSSHEKYVSSHTQSENTTKIKKLYISSVSNYMWEPYSDM